MHDLGVAADVRGGRCIVREFGEVRKAPHFRVEPRGLQRLEHRHAVGGLAELHDLHDVLVDELVVASAEVVGRNDVDDAVEGRIFDHQAAEDRLFALNALRRTPYGRGFVVKVGHGENLYVGCPSSSTLGNEV